MEKIEALRQIGNLCHISIPIGLVGMVFAFGGSLKSQECYSGTTSNLGQSFNASVSHIGLCQGIEQMSGILFYLSLVIILLPLGSYLVLSVLTNGDSK